MKNITARRICLFASNLCILRVLFMTITSLQQQPPISYDGWMYAHEGFPSARESANGWPEIAFGLDDRLQRLDEWGECDPATLTYGVNWERGWRYERIER